MSETVTQPSGGATARKGEPLMEVRDLVKHFPLTSGIIFQRKVGAVQAVDGVSFDVMRGETLGLVGESGCGKSTTARLLLRLMDPTSGSIRFEGQEISDLSGERLKTLRQDPAQSSSIVLTTITDIAGFMTFLGLASVFSSLLE